MSLSETLRKYEQALTESNQRQEGLYSKRNIAVKRFYDTFMKQVIRKYESKTSDKKWIDSTTSRIREFFGKDKIIFLAVDGTSDKVPLEEYAVFFAASYGVRGQFSLNDYTTSYIKRDLSEELSMVAYVPIPFAELGEISIAELDDQSRFSNAEIHNRLMMLAELYLIFNEIQSESPPDVILWDQSFSGMFHWVAPPLKGIPMVNNGYKFDTRKLTRGDALISRSHPTNSALGVPAATTGFYNLPSRIVYELEQSSSHQTTIPSICKITGESNAEVRRVLNSFMNQYAILDVSGDIITLRKAYYDSWAYVVKLVTSLCSHLFKEKDAKSLIYDNKWITSTDIDFMMSILIRTIVEKSWAKKVLLLGIVKDSASKYFIQNYLGVLRKTGIYSGYRVEDVFNLLWTDRLTLESLMDHDSGLNAPWATVEFDSVFQIVYLATRKGTLEVMMRPVPTTEELFAKSLVLLFSTRKHGQAIFNHMLFLDRAIVPSLDKPKLDRRTIDVVSADTRVKVSPFLDLQAGEENIVQDFAIFFLNKLTTNRFPDVIGYPEPLHRADLGAKTFNKMVQPLIRSSTSEAMRSKPWLASVRQKRKFR